MVIIYLYYGFYLVDILNNYSFLFCLLCVFSWILFIIWDWEVKFFWIFIWVLFIFYFGSRSTIFFFEFLYRYGKYGAVYIFYYVWYLVSKKCYEADVEVRVEDFFSFYRFVSDDGYSCVIRSFRGKYF